MVLGDAIQWADENDCAILLVETAGLCLRCAPYVDGGLGIVVLEATSGMNLPLKVGPMLSLADVAVVTKIDRVSQAEREVFRARIQDVAPDDPDPRGQRPVRHRHRPAGRGYPGDARRPARTCCCAATRRWAPAPSASARRKSAGSRTSASCARWTTRTSTGGSSRWPAASTSTTPPRRRSTRACVRRWSSTWTASFGNPSSLHYAGREAHAGVDAGARRRGGADRRASRRDRLHGQRHRGRQPGPARRPRAPAPAALTSSSAPSSTRPCSRRPSTSSVAAST